MRKRIRNIWCDTDKDLLAHREEAEGKSTLVFEAYYHRRRQLCYLYTYSDKNGDIENEVLKEKTIEEMNEFFEFVGSPSRIFTNKKEHKEYLKKSETEPVTVNA